LNLLLVVLPHQGLAGLVSRRVLLGVRLGAEHTECRHSVQRWAIGGGDHVAAAKVTPKVTKKV